MARDWTHCLATCRERGIGEEGRKASGRKAGRKAGLRQEETRRKGKEGKSGKERQEGTKEESQEH
jgi:hypothetical protein